MSATRRPFLHWSPARYTVWKVRNAWSASDVQSGKTAIILSAGTGAIRSAKERQTSATSQNLEGMKLIELKELAKQMGLRGTSTMRKPELVATLQAARSGGEAPAGVTVRPVKGAASKRPSRRSRCTGRADSGTAPKAEPREVHRCQRRMMRWPDWSRLCPSPMQPRPARRVSPARRPPNPTARTTAPRLLAVAPATMQRRARCCRSV